jgi:hypothetical protein
MSKKGITPKKTIDPIEQILGDREKEQTKDEIHRFAFNIPKYLYNIVQPKAKKQGMTLTNYILLLIRKDIGEL